jgi:hypothetical protein
LKGEIDHWNVTDLPTLRATSASALESVQRAAGISDGPSSSHKVRVACRSVSRHIESSV